jgi:hypothetical protein
MWRKMKLKGLVWKFEGLVWYLKRKKHIKFKKWIKTKQIVIKKTRDKIKRNGAWRDNMGCGEPNMTLKEKKEKEEDVSIH